MFNHPSQIFKRKFCPNSGKYLDFNKFYQHQVINYRAAEAGTHNCWLAHYENPVKVTINPQVMNPTLYLYMCGGTERCQCPHQYLRKLKYKGNAKWRVIYYKFEALLNGGPKQHQMGNFVSDEMRPSVWAQRDRRGFVVDASWLHGLLCVASF